MVEKVRIANVDTVMPEWIGLEVKLLSTFKNIRGHKYFEVELPLKDYEGRPIEIILSEHQIVKGGSNGRKQ